MAKKVSTTIEVKPNECSSDACKGCLCDAPLEVEVKSVNPQLFIIDWVDTNTFVPTPGGKLEPAGTTLLFNNNITYLKHLSSDQLLELKRIVTEAVDHELSKPSRKCK